MKFFDTPGQFRPGTFELKIGELLANLISLLFIKRGILIFCLGGRFRRIR